MLIKTEHANILRDTDTNALINKDVLSFQQYKENRDKNIRVDVLASEVDSIKSELTDIKRLLIDIASRK